MLDRIDVQIEVKRPSYEKIKINSNLKNEKSEEIKKRINIVRQIQLERYEKEGISTNAELTSKLINKYCELDSKSEKILEEAFRRFNLSVRAYEKILKLSRTIADLDLKEKIEYKHVAEAIQYRSLDRIKK